MEEQSYAKHAKFVPMYHFVTAGLIFISLVLSLVLLYRRLRGGGGTIVISILTIHSIALLLLFIFARVFAMKVQDRAIRAEENLRHYVLTGKPLDRRLTIRQIVGLRFASDEEFPGLAQRAADEGLALDTIKKSVQHWRPDYDRA